MELHPTEAVDELLAQHAAVLGEIHGDLLARFEEIPDRFADQGTPRPFGGTHALLDTFLITRQRRQDESTTLKARGGRGMSVVLEDDHGTEIRVRRHPKGPDGEYLTPSNYSPDAMQFTLDTELKLAKDHGWEYTKQAYGLFILHSGADMANGVVPVLAAGVLTDDVEVLFAMTPLPKPIYEQRVATEGLVARLRESSSGVTPEPTAPQVIKPRQRRRTKDFDDLMPVKEDTSSDEPS